MLAPHAACVATEVRSLTEDAGQAGVNAPGIRDEHCRHYCLAVHAAFQDVRTIEVVFDASGVANRNTEVFADWSPDIKLKAYLPPSFTECVPQRMCCCTTFTLLDVTPGCSPLHARLPETGHQTVAIDT